MIYSVTCSHTPEFEKILYSFIVPENLTVGSVIGSVRATDEEEGRFGDITYSLIGDSVHRFFRIHKETGEL